MADDLFIVWSNEHRAFWRPHRCGYTTHIEDAGRYSEEEAIAICRGWNYRSGSVTQSGVAPEIYMPAPEALERAREELLAALRELMPERVCLTNRNIRDDMIIPCDVHIGALRRAAAAIAKATGAPC